MTRLALLLLAVLALCNVAVRAEEDDAPYEGDDGSDEDLNLGDEGLLEEEDLEESMLIYSHPDIKTTYVLPDYSELSIPFGKPIDILVGITNLGKEDKDFNITGVIGSINSPFDYSYYVQNLSRLEMNTLIKPGEQMSVLYTFTPDKNLEAMDFQLSAHVFYEDQDSERYATTFYNETTTFYESKAALDPKELFLYVSGVSFVGLVFLLVVRALSGKAKSAPPKKKGGAAPDNEWIDGIINQNKAAKAKSLSGSKSPSKKGKKL